MLQSMGSQRIGHDSATELSIILAIWGLLPFHTNFGITLQIFTKVVRIFIRIVLDV